MAKKVNLTSDQVKELKRLAEAQQYAEEAKAIRGRYKAFVDDNEEALRAGIEQDGLVLGVKISKQLVVELA